MIHLSTYSIIYGQKKGWESKCQFDFQPLKVKNCLDLHVCKWHTTYHWKAFDKGYNFTLNFTSIRVLQEIMSLQSGKSFNFKNFRTPDSKVPRENDIWVQPSWSCIEITLRGKVVASPKFEPWWVLWVRVCSWFILAPKMF
jgi:hypothetical protein